MRTVLYVMAAQQTQTICGLCMVDLFHFFLAVQVCQHADQYYNCGRHKQPIWIWYIPYYSEMNSNNTSFSFPDWRIEYPGGTQWRWAIVTCVYQYNA